MTSVLYQHRSVSNVEQLVDNKKPLLELFGTSSCFRYMQLGIELKIPDQPSYSLTFLLSTMNHQAYQLWSYELFTLTTISIASVPCVLHRMTGFSGFVLALSPTAQRLLIKLTVIASHSHLTSKAADAGIPERA